MSFTFKQSDRVKRALDFAGPLLEEEVFPKEMEWLRADPSQVEPELELIRNKVRNSPYWAPQIAIDNDSSFSLLEFAQFSEYLGRSPFGHFCFNCNAPDAGNMELLHAFASEHIKAAFLEPLHEGKIRSCFCMTEPEYAGSNPVHMGTTAQKEGDEYRIDGHKWFSTGADGAAFALVMAVTDEAASSPYGKASILLVPTDNPGFELVRNISVMGEEGHGIYSHAEVRFENCRVPASNIIGSEGAGFALAQERLGPGRIHHCMRWIGICERAMDLMCKRAVSRKLSDRRMLAHQQSVQNWIAESRAEIDAARLMVLQTAELMQERGAQAVRESISTIKFFVANIMLKVLDRAIQTHGALGITDDLVLSFWYRHERGARIYDGPDEVHKSVVARRILANYGFDPRKKQ